MSRPPGQTKQRMLTSAVALLRERGAGAVTIDAVLAHSGAPRGSVYHHFPGGRNELILGAVRQAGDYITAMLDAATAAGEPARALEQFVGMWKHVLGETGYLAGCPIVAAAVHTNPDLPEVTVLVHDIFTRWRSAIRELLVADGFTGDRAQRLATLSVAAIEGAVILCRAGHTDTPLDDVLTEIKILLAPGPPPRKEMQ